MKTGLEFNIRVTHAMDLDCPPLAGHYVDSDRASTANASVCCRQDDFQEMMQVLRTCHGADVNIMRAGVY